MERHVLRVILYFVFIVNFLAQFGPYTRAEDRHYLAVLSAIALAGLACSAGRGSAPTAIRGDDGDQ